MTTDEKRIIIAEWEGLFVGLDYLPRYSHDLNVLAPLKAHLTTDQWLRFQEHLTDVTGARHADGKSRSFVNLRRLMCASAEEQCEALVRMIKEETK